MTPLEKFSTPKSESKRWGKKAVDDYYQGEVEPESDGEEFAVDRHELEPLPDSLISTDDFAASHSSDELHELYDNYARAMRRRNREPLEQDNFEYHFFEEGSSEPTCMYGTDKQGYLLGYYKHGVFVPSHFAPKSLRMGYELMRDLGDSTDVPAVMAITPDLEETLKKMPAWKSSGFEFPSQFRGDSVPKKIVYNSHPDTQRLMYGLVSDYLRERGRDLDTSHDTEH